MFICRMINTRGSISVGGFAKGLPPELLEWWAPSRWAALWQGKCQEIVNHPYALEKLKEYLPADIELTGPSLPQGFGRQQQQLEDGYDDINEDD
jgi:hypothetical protein